MGKSGIQTIALCIVLSFSTSISAKSHKVTSPDKQLVVRVTDDSGTIQYTASFQGNPIIEPSRLGLLFNNKKDFAQPLQIAQSERNAVNQTWEQPWGERKFVKDQHNELLLQFAGEDGKSLTTELRIRVFNDGFGFRYEGRDHNKSVEITDELTEFRVAQPDKVDSWWIPSRGWNRYEYLYESTTLDKVDRAHTPFTFRLPSGVHLSIHEAALVDFAAMTLDQQRVGVLKADLTPRSDGLKVKTNGDFVSSWRSVQVSEKAVGLLNSSLILNLNEPNKLGDVSWVKPGKYVGIWWGMHLNVNTWGSGNKHGATTKRTMEYMDFAAKNGFDGVLVEGWNIGWDGNWYENGDVFNFTKSYPDFDIAKVAQHGKKVGVRLIGHHETSGGVTNYENQMQDAYAFYAKHNVAQVKTGYVADGGDIKRTDEKGIVRKEWHDSQFMVNHYLHSVKEAARYKISINTHEPIKDTGLRRTYPNWISREGARGQEFNAWGSPPNTPEHTTILGYTRMLSGPMDFTPGIFNLAYQGLDAENRVQTTLAKQLALYVVLYSPIQMAADLIEHYALNLDAFQFIKDVPTDWQESIALAGEVGDFTVFARQQRDTDDWFVGAITDENARAIELELSFLAPNRTYQAEIYQDGSQANWKTKPYELDILKRTVTRTDKINLKLATSGGAAIRFKAL